MGQMTHAWPRRGCRGSSLIVWLLALLHVCHASDKGLEEASDQLACDLSRPEWRAYHEAFEAAARATAEQSAHVRATARTALAKSLLDRTSNVSDVLSCNVGVIAGYYLVSRLVSPTVVASLGMAGCEDGQGGLAYRLLQMALVFIFTLRNANRVPLVPGAAWGISEQSIIPAIMQLRRSEDTFIRQRLERSVPIAPDFRDPSLRIGIVSICAYPDDHPIALTKVTPRNRDAYARRHGYKLRVHLEPPILGAPDLGIQHAKIAAVLAYLQTGEFDWIAWLDCDSIIMNMDRTLDSIIYQYSQQANRRSTSPGADSTAASDELSPVCGGIDLSGAWFDSWVPEEDRHAAVIQLEQDGRDGSRVVARAPQFGGASGRRLGALNGAAEDVIELEFEGSGSLRGVVQTEAGVAVRLEWENGAVWTREDVGACREPCRSPECAGELDADTDLLITEEGWGLSSANWLVRRSRWSIDFLHDTLTAAHVEMKMFGDQDAMIFHLMNRQALEAAASAEMSVIDPLDRHAVVVPQFELNAYDALNALTMDCDMFVEGDFLVTFPQCKDADGCNDVFNLADDYAEDEEKPAADPDAGAWWRRCEASPRWSRYNAASSAAIRVFGPRPWVREVFLRERERGDGGD